MTDTYLAVFLGGQHSSRAAEWAALPEDERMSRTRKGIAAWKSWCEDNADAIVVMGGPLGRTKSVGPAGIADAGNLLCAYMVLRAGSHEAAARLLEGHPHFTIFPGDGVEIMPVLPIPDEKSCA
jgi:hypothetical protein